MRILVDVDGVCADTHASWLEMYNADYDDNLTSDKVTRWEMHKLVNPECGARIYDYLRWDNFYDKTQPIPDSLPSVWALREAGHHIVYVSAGMYTAKVKWLHVNGFLDEYPHGRDKWESCTDVVLAGDKALVSGDILVDDRFENAYEWSVTGKLAILFDQPWNRNGLTNRSIVRAYNWQDVVEIIGEESMSYMPHDRRMA